MNLHPTTKVLRVTCAIIEKEGMVLCAQRSASMKLPLKWEFPGGKVEPGETEEECLLRECREELNLEVSIASRQDAVKHEFEPGKWLVLIPFRCALTGGTIKLNEHANAKWVEPASLRKLDWAEADVDVVENYLRTIGLV